MAPGWQPVVPGLAAGPLGLAWSRAGSRRSAVSYVLENDGSPLPVGRDWAARSLEFVAPQPFIRPIFRGPPVPIPAIAEAGRQQTPHAKDEHTTLEVKDTHETAGRCNIPRRETAKDYIWNCLHLRHLQE